MPFVREAGLLLVSNSNNEEHVHHTQMYSVQAKITYNATYRSSSHNLIINEIHRTICVGEGYADRCSYVGCTIKIQDKNVHLRVN